MKENVENDYYSFATCVVTFLNAILLYLTLISQNRSFRKERFETTFFNLLDNHRKVTDEIVIETISLNNHDITDNHLYTYKWKGSKSVYQACYDAFWIRKALSTKSYKGNYNRQEINSAELAIDYMYDGAQMEPEIYYKKTLAEKGLHEECQYKLINSIYGINKDMLRDTDKQDIDSLAHQLYWKKWKTYWEHYIRSFQQILVHINVNISDDEGKMQYTDYVLSQLSNKEIGFIRWRAKYDDNLMKCLIECGIDNQ